MSDDSAICTREPYLMPWAQAFHPQLSYICETYSHSLWAQLLSWLRGFLVKNHWTSLRQIVLTT